MRKKQRRESDQLLTITGGIHLGGPGGQERTAGRRIRPAGASRRTSEERQDRWSSRTKLLNCVDCGTEFLWTAGEQLFFADKNFKK